MSEEVTTICPFCNREDALIMQSGYYLPEGYMKTVKEFIGQSMAYKIKCKSCGLFRMIPINTIICKNMEYEDIFDDLHLISGYIKNHNFYSQEESPIINNEKSELDNLVNELKNYDDITNKITAFLSYLKSSSKYFGEHKTISTEFDYPYAYAKNQKEFETIIKHLIKLDYIESTHGFNSSLRPDLGEIVLTLKGIEYLNKGNIDSNRTLQVSY